MIARAALALLALALVACGGSAQKSRASAIGEVIERAREAGAIRCAPVELAMAESHHAFGDQELAEGNYYRAREELDVAEHNANEAMRKSPQGRCVDSAPVMVPQNDDADGDGIKNAVDDCPKRPEDMDGYADADGCPEADNDADGLDDEVDDCPNQPEDRDGFEDDDGCPDVDNDGDGLSDRLDECPDQAEDDDGFEDDDGCPDCDNDGDGVLECPEAIDKCPDKAANTADGCPAYKNIVVTDEKIELRQTVYFDTGKATIKRISYDLLDEVGQALADNPKISVRIEGHTDSRGKDAYNLRLSQDRAESVRAYLIGRGVSPSRMVAKGYGERVPLADNRTDRGRDQNRRVEFVILDR